MLARTLITAQFPDVECRAVSLISEGWDYVVHRVDDVWAFRFPRREVVLDGTARELATLGRLADLLPVPVPSPRYVGSPSGLFPWKFYGARFLAGSDVGEARPGDVDRLRIARELALTLRELHSAETLRDLGEGMPFDPIRRVDMQHRVPLTRKILATCTELWVPPAGVDALLKRAVELPPPEPVALCHGDLHFRQLLIAGGRLTGIIDWVDICRSDPGVDLQIVWSFIPPSERSAFFDLYGSVSEDSLIRARVVALYLNAILLDYGRKAGSQSIVQEARSSLQRTVTGDL